MATLKRIQTRLKSVKNIQKITQSMKMIAAARYTKAERELKPVRLYGDGATALYSAAEVEALDQKENHLIIAVSSDRGLCGGIHSNVSKAVKATMAEKGDTANVKMIIIGDKARTQLQRCLLLFICRLYADNIMFSVNDYGRKTPAFEDASMVAGALLDSGYEFDTGEIIFNRFRSVVSYKTSSQPVFPFNVLSQSEKMSIYDDVDSDILRCYSEFQLASILYYTLMEANCSEQSSRMTAMDNASKNAGKT
ncbi:ATP synthase subunit gamma, mitochondrial [Holothuria leucospilota]|uniref:ATP synthase subunit gamma n=1 Tax=Holothuria leucospilota TaxID=206669 RepID=A0A9Q1CLQ2_HOLLE|nr:ATP synthase subunit gamma, mitochondrial [Holothuria leucospilota]